MSDQPKGTRLKLSPARKMTVEMLRHAQRVPTVPVARTCNIAAAVAARAQAAPAPSWTAVFIRAYGLVAQRFGELRRAYVPWPTAHLYEHPHSTCALVVERDWEGETLLLAAKIRAPESATLHAIHGHIRHFKEAPVPQISDFRQLLRLGKMPGLVRRFAFWQSLYLSGAKRAKRFGTFMVSSYGSLGAEQVHPLAPFTSLLTFGPIAPNGDVVVKLIYDHRVMDGRYVARCLGELEHVLNGELVAELRSVSSLAA